MTPLMDTTHPPSPTSAGQAQQHGETQSERDTSSPNVGSTPDGTVRSRKTARVSHGSEPTTEVVVHYAVPEGQRYLPITLNHTVTMIHIGRHNGDHVYEPTNT